MHAKKTENPWLSLACNILLPAIILTKLSAPAKLGPQTALVCALAFPLLYGIYDYITRRKFSWIAAIGFLGILIKGGLGLLKINIFWFAVNEAAIPALIGIILWVSVLMGRPLVGVFLLNESVVDLEKINSAIASHNAEQTFAKHLKQATYLLILSFAVSAVLNFVLAIYLLKSPVGTEEFNQELGYMTAVSMPIILICSSSIMVVALWRLIKQIQTITGLDLDAIFHAGAKAKPRQDP